MPEVLQKLRPDRDLQCYFERPSAIAAMSNCSPAGFTVSGEFRQQFDWAVIEWNRDNVFEHPRLRYLPDGDLSGLVLSYEEARVNCMPIDSTIYPTVDWPYLRIWADTGLGTEEFYRVPLLNYAEPVEGNYVPAHVVFELTGTPTAGDYVGLSWLNEHHTYQVLSSDTLETIIQALVASVNTFSNEMEAEAIGNKIKLYYVGEGQTIATSRTGANGNRIGVYTYVTGSGSLAWDAQWKKLSGGLSPTRWRITLPFAQLVDEFGRPVPTTNVRKMRWTYAADYQQGEFVPVEFEVQVTNWTVTGTRRYYQVVGGGSFRIEDDSAAVQYQGEWLEDRGNYSGGSLHYSLVPGSAVEIRYRAWAEHHLYLGVRRAFNSGAATIQVDDSPVITWQLKIPGEDVLCRIPLGIIPAGEHRVVLQHAGSFGEYLYFDFLEIVFPQNELPEFPSDPSIAAATDWDTDHSMALAPERTAWLIKKLGFTGRTNHYVGALWFYRIYPKGHQYASTTVTFSGTPQFSCSVQLRIGRVGEPPESQTVISHLVLIGDTAELIAKAFELIINSGFTAIRAEAQGNQLRIFSRLMGVAGNQLTVQASTTCDPDVFTVSVESPTLVGGVDGEWTTDISAVPRLNRAVRDWSRSFFQALAKQGMSAVAAFSMELQHADPSPEAGIAQRYPSGQPVRLNTPAIQTNFSSTSQNFWKEVYREMAALMAEAGLQPYLQFGEVQWWYFPSDGSGLPFYDEYTVSEFQRRYGRLPATILDPDTDPAAYPEEAEFFRSLIGEFTEAIISHVRTYYPTTKFEVLYPTDVNAGKFLQVANLPVQWNPAILDSFKTESFTYTFSRDLNAGKSSLLLPLQLGFDDQRSHFLVGVMDYTTPWLRQVDQGRSKNLKTVVLWALDQFCLIGYELPLKIPNDRATFMGR